MKAKLITHSFSNGFETKLNEFLADPSIEVIEVKIASPIFTYTALVFYEDKDDIPKTKED